MSVTRLARKQRMEVLRQRRRMMNQNTMPNVSFDTSMIQLADALVSLNDYSIKINSTSKLPFACESYMYSKWNGIPRG